MWLGFGFFSLLPILFIFLVLHMVRIALRETRGQRRPEAVWGRDYREQTAAREQPRRGRLENRVFRLAYRLGGRLTVSDLVVDLDFSIGEAESFLNQLVDSTRVTMEVRDDGLVYYEFPEIIARRHRGAPNPHRDVASSTIHQGSGDLLCRASQLARGAF